MFRSILGNRRFFNPSRNIKFSTNSIIDENKNFYKIWKNSITFGSISGFFFGMYKGIRYSNEEKLIFKEKVSTTVLLSVMYYFVGFGIGMMMPIIVPVSGICVVEHLITNNKKKE